MKAGDLVQIRQGSRHGKMGVIVKVGGKQNGIWIGIGVLLDGGVFHYYRRDLEVIYESG